MDPNKNLVTQYAWIRVRVGSVSWYLDPPAVCAPSPDVMSDKRMRVLIKATLVRVVCSSKMAADPQQLSQLETAFASVRVCARPVMPCIRLVYDATYGVIL